MVFVPNSHSNTILTATSPIKGSYPGEIYAIIISLLYPDIHLFPQPLIYAIDNLTTCSNLNLIQSSSTFPFNSNTNSFSSWYLLLWHLLKKTNLTIIFTWIKGHANFEGNNVADTISKWISSHIHIPTNQLTPPEFPSILHNNTPVPGKVTTKHTKHLHDAHTHNNIHLSFSTIFFLNSSWFSRLNFKWVNGLFSCKGYAPHYNLKDYTCPLCHTKHPLDPTSFTALCPSPKATHLRQLINNTRSTTTHTTINNWYLTATPGEKRNYIRTLIPTSLSNDLRTPPPNTSYSSHKSHLLRELKYRTKPLNNVLHSLSQWFQDNSIPNFDSRIPISDNNPWYIPNSEFSTSSTQPVKLSYPSFPNKPPINKNPHSHRHTFLKPKPKKHNLIQLYYSTTDANSPACTPPPETTACTHIPRPSHTTPLTPPHFPSTAWSLTPPLPSPILLAPPCLAVISAPSSSLWTASVHSYIYLAVSFVLFLSMCLSAPIPLHSACHGIHVVHSDLSQAYGASVQCSAPWVWDCVQYSMSLVDFGSP